MKNIIKSICCSGAFSTDECGMKNQDIKKLYKQLLEKSKQLRNKIPDELKKELEEYDNLVTELSMLFYEEYFVKGFELGMKIAIKVLYN